jgi:BlaI family penicillinase repressor
MSSRTSKASEKSVAPRISEAEWKVMHTVWEIGPATLREIVDHLSADENTDWKPRTIQTLVRRLGEKGALTSEPTSSGREFCYSAAISRSECQQKESRSFLGRVFDGRLAPFIAGFVEQEKISQDEIDELRALLNRVEKSTPADK